MYQFEKKIVDWINRYMVHIAILFVLFASAWIRLAGRNYVGIDYHYSLYDIPGNCNSLPYRLFVDLLMRTDYAIVLLKFLAYIGDFGVAFLTLCLLWKEKQTLWDLRTFLILSATLLSPASLLYSVGGMEIDSVCMCFLLLGFLFLQKGKLGLAASVMAIAALLYPPYLPIVGGILIFVVVVIRQKQGITSKLLVPIGIFIGFVLLSVLFETFLSTENYFWGKLFIVNPVTGLAYEDFLLWLRDMFKIFGYFFASGSLIFAMKDKKMRIPALILQVLVIVIVGRLMTAHLADIF